MQLVVALNMSVHFLCVFLVYLNIVTNNSKHLFNYLIILSINGNFFVGLKKKVTKNWEKMV